jgi:hypothetical protein
MLPIAEQYDTKFGKDLDAVSVDVLRRQWADQFPTITKVVSLGSKAYDDGLSSALPSEVTIERAGLKRRCGQTCHSDTASI